MELDDCQKELHKCPLNAELQILGSKMVNRKSVLEGVMRQGEKKHWPSVVWSRLNCPKHSFIFWLTILQRLKTKDRVLDTLVPHNNALKVKVGPSNGALRTN
ncbi:hypothetical protein G4B88_000993 [Cannabis sativa]|uniref:Reverse transcriptase zinc-binding domain-containing protein n=1 Tax=Cannabis sativa TaxID=3483 RepID=A0A7J6FDG2_CANSA|nr:hypothetical protein G4B88_000993 [Cannabis sativa]